MNYWAVAAIALLGLAGAAAGVGLAQAFLALTAEDYSDIWDWDDTEEV